MHDRGQGVPQDGQKAAEWYRKAAHQGHGDAAYNLGMMYFEGDLIEKEPFWAWYYMDKAHMAGVVDATFELGFLYLNGIGTDKNGKAALNRFSQAAVSGHPGAMAALAKIFATGDIVPENIGLAYEWTVMALRAHELSPEEYKLPQEAVDRLEEFRKAGLFGLPLETLGRATRGIEINKSWYESAADLGKPAD